MYFYKIDTKIIKSVWEALENHQSGLKFAGIFLKMGKLKIFIILVSKANFEEKKMSLFYLLQT